MLKAEGLLKSILQASVYVVKKRKQHR